MDEYPESSGNGNGNGYGGYGGSSSSSRGRGGYGYGKAKKGGNGGGRKDPFAPSFVVSTSNGGGKSKKRVKQNVINFRPASNQNNRLGESAIEGSNKDTIQNKIQRINSSSNNYNKKYKLDESSASNENERRIAYSSQDTPNNYSNNGFAAEDDEGATYHGSYGTGRTLQEGGGGEGESFEIDLDKLPRSFRSSQPSPPAGDVKMHEIMMGGVKVQFPFPNPYPCQLQVMSKIINCLKSSSNGIFESPTGTGKTLAILCSSISWLQMEREKAAAEAKVKEEANLAAQKERQRERKESGLGGGGGSGSGVENKYSKLKRMREQALANQIKNEVQVDSFYPSTSTASNDTLAVSQNIPIETGVISEGESFSKFFPPTDETSDLVPPLFTTATNFLRGPITIPPDDDSEVLEGRRSDGEGANLVMHDLKKFKRTDRLTAADIEQHIQYEEHVAASELAKPPPPPRLPKIYIASRTQKQLQQMIKELKNKTDLKPRMAILSSREHSCVNDTVLNSKESKNEHCSSLLQTPGACKYYEKARSTAQRVKDEKPIHDIEDLITIGRALGGCSYYAGRELAASAEVIFAPYNYFLDPLVRTAMSIDLTGNILIVDEAHNVEGCATDAASIEVLVSDIASCCLEIKGYGNATGQPVAMLAAVLTGLTNWAGIHMNDSLNVEDNNKRLKIWSGSEAKQMLTQSGVRFQDMPKMKSQLQEIISNTSSSSTDSSNSTAKFNISLAQIISKILMVLDYLSAREVDYRMVLKSTTNAKNNGLSIEFWCLNPAVVFQEIGETCKSVILTSGTLSPMVSYQKELGIPFNQSIEANHVIKPDQIWAGIITSNPNGGTITANYNNLSNPDFQDQLGISIYRLTAKIPGGCLVFVPSYSLLDKLQSRWAERGIWAYLDKAKNVFIEPSTKGTAGSGDLEWMIEQYDKACRTPEGAVMFCVYRGKMSEGMDFANERARGVICIGIPFPNVKDPKLMECKNHHTKNAKNSNIMDGEMWYKTLAFRALNQALGRCIRHQDDWGSVILLESRFSIPSNVEMLPKWFRRFLPPAYRSFEEALVSLENFMIAAVVKHVKKERQVMEQEEKEEMKEDEVKEEEVKEVKEERQDDFPATPAELEYTGSAVNPIEL